MTPGRKPLTKTEFEALSEFRYQMRRFERFSEDVVQTEGITPLQYLLLLHIKGYPGRDWATVGELAERLQAKPHGVVALVTRCEERRPGRAPRQQRGRPAAASRCTCCPAGEAHPDAPGRPASRRTAVAAAACSPFRTSIH